MEIFGTDAFLGETRTQWTMHAEVLVFIKWLLAQTYSRVKKQWAKRKAMHAAAQADITQAWTGMCTIT
jgi:hypothetical protein